MVGKYRVIYKVRNDDYWDVWKDNILTFEEAEKVRIQATKIFCTPTRIQFLNIKKENK